MSHLTEALPKTGDHIRLLALEPATDWDAPLVCSVHTFQLGDHLPAYHALSYAWGAGSFDRAITFNGNPFAINSSLDAALRSCRHPTEPCQLWVDQLCIRQNDVSEKNHQIPLMSKIFAQYANGVIAWLGEADQDTLAIFEYADWVLGEPLVDEGTEHLEAAGAGIRKLDFNTRRDVDHGRSAFIRLLRDRPWFHRSWIVQEAAAQKERLMLKVGRFGFWYSKFLDVVIFTNQRMTAELRTPSANLKHPLGRTSFFTVLRFCPAIEAADHGQGKLQDLVERFSSWKASDPRDKIYAFLALAKNADKYERPDYNLSVKEVYRQFSAVTMQHGLINVLVALTFAAMSSPITDYPSWITDWTTFEKNEITSPMRNNFAFSAGGPVRRRGDYVFDGQTLTLRGRLVGSVAELTAWQPSESLFSDEWVSHAKQTLSGAGTLDIFDDEMTRDLAELLVLDGDSSLYSSGGREKEYLEAIIVQQAQTRKHYTGNAPAYHPDRNEEAGSPPSRLELYARLGANPAALVNNFPSVGSRVPELNSSVSDPGPLQGSSRPEERHLIEYRNMVLSVLTNHVIMRAADGRAGICNWKARSGDEIVIIRGARLPFILRRIDGGNRFRLISEAYIRGLMFESEIPASERNEVEDLIIC